MQIFPLAQKIMKLKRVYEYLKFLKCADSLPKF